MRPPVLVDAPERLGAILEFWGKAAGALMAVYLLLEKVGKPYFKWRQERFASTIREILKEEILAMQHVGSEAEAIRVLLERIIENQEAIFTDMDDFITIAQDNRDRHDETTALIDNMAGIPDRRSGTERRSVTNQHMDALMEGIERRAKNRRRGLGGMMASSTENDA